ncbi:MAG: DUF4214 domain-containing protein [Saccharofermentans sp.]|nr:DUF4214 domain-containing protein [Saccharofermentans sp.]
MRFTKLISVLITASTVLSLVAANTFAAGKGAVAITKENFPDAKLRGYLSFFVDVNKNDIVDEGEFSGKLDLQNEGVTDLTGIDKLYITDFKYTDMSAELTKIDLSGNPELETLYINITTGPLGFDSLDLSANTNLKDIFIRLPKLEKPVEIGNKPYLTKLSLFDNNQGTIDLSGCPNLEDVVIYDMNFTGLDITGCPKIYSLNIQSIAKYTELDISNCPYLSRVYKETPRVTGLFNNYSWKSEDGSVQYVYMRISNKATVTAMEDTSNVTPPVTPTAAPTEKPTVPPTVPPTVSPTVSPTPTPEADPLGDFVDRLYQVALGRNADPSGKASWVQVLKDGTSGADVAKGFLYSPEFTSKNLSDADYIDALYKVFFNRPADPEGKQSWLDFIKMGATKQYVLEGFIGSKEWSLVCADYGIKTGADTPNDVSAFVTRLYTTCLGRTPDASGHASWLNALVTHQGGGSKVAHNFFFSDEFVNAKLSNEAYVTRLYITMMNRLPDAQGKQGWVDALNSGYSRETVFQGFANSIEWGIICDNYGIDK